MARMKVPAVYHVSRTSLFGVLWLVVSLAFGLCIYFGDFDDNGFVYRLLSLNRGFCENHSPLVDGILPTWLLPSR